MRLITGADVSAFEMAPDLADAVRELVAADVEGGVIAADHVHHTVWLLAIGAGAIHDAAILTDFYPDGIPMDRPTVIGCPGPFDPRMVAEELKRAHDQRQPPTMH